MHRRWRLYRFNRHRRSVARGGFGRLFNLLKFLFFAFQAGGDETTTTFFRRTTPGAGVASAEVVLFSAGFRFRLSTGRFSSLIRGHINKSYRSEVYDTLTVSSFHLAMQWTQR